jgi:threonine synthase
MATDGWSDVDLMARCVCCQLEVAAAGAPLDGCPRCRERGLGSNFALVVPTAPGMPLIESKSTGIWRFGPRLPLVPPEDRVTLGEGGTPLFELPRFPGLPEDAGLWVKDESLNPTLSYKDRFMAAATSRARFQKERIVAASSSGNGGASAAAYAARAGLRCVVFATAGIPQPPRRFVESVGAELIALPGTSARWDLLRATVEEWGWYPLTNFAEPPNGSNLFGIGGYKTIAYEIVEASVGPEPDWVVVPLSMGDGLYGIWQGFVELEQLGLISRLPRMVAVEPAEAAPLASSLAAGADHLETVSPSASVAYNVGSSRSSEQALAAIRASDGVALAMPETEILPLKAELAAGYGIYAEASSVLALWGARQILRAGQTAVSIVTSSGLKDPDPTAPPEELLEPIEPTLQALAEALPRELRPG